MLILFDNGTPAPLRFALTEHIVVEAIERGWDRLMNGELIAAASVKRGRDSSCLPVPVMRTAYARMALARSSFGGEGGDFGKFPTPRCNRIPPGGSLLVPHRRRPNAEPCARTSIGRERHEGVSMLPRNVEEQRSGRDGDEQIRRVREVR